MRGRVFAFVQTTARCVLLMLAGLCGVIAGVVALRQMDDRPGVPVLADVWSAVTRRPRP